MGSILIVAAYGVYVAFWIRFLLHALLWWKTVTRPATIVGSVSPSSVKSWAFSARDVVLFWRLLKVNPALWFFPCSGVGMVVSDPWADRRVYPSLVPALHHRRPAVVGPGKIFFACQHGFVGPAVRDQFSRPPDGHAVQDRCRGGKIVHYRHPECYTGRCAGQHPVPAAFFPGPGPGPFTPDPHPDRS